jgi:hypothetical protein
MFQQVLISAGVLSKVQQLLRDIYRISIASP